MKNSKEDYDIEIPSDDDENVGDGVPKKKKEKRRKTKEEKRAERKVIFWTLVIVVFATMLFWIIPRSGKIKISIPSFEIKKPDVSLPKTEMKGYWEYKL